MYASSVRCGPKEIQRKESYEVVPVEIISVEPLRFSDVPNLNRLAEVRSSVLIRSKNYFLKCDEYPCSGLILLLESSLQDRKRVRICWRDIGISNSIFQCFGTAESSFDGSVYNDDLVEAIWQF